MKLGMSYFGNRIPEHFTQRDLPEIVDTGCTFILHTFSEHDLEYYRGAVAEMITASKQAGLDVYLDPWGVAGVFGGEAYSRFLLDHPDAWQVSLNGNRRPQACPNSPALRAFMDEWTGAAASAGADVLFWDEPHFTLDGDRAWRCHCTVCQALFEEQYAGPIANADAEKLMAFAEDSTVRFVEQLCAGGAAHGMRNAVCLLPFDDGHLGPAHWEKLATIPALDILAVTPFWHFRGQEVQAYVRLWSTIVAEICQAYGKEPQAWLQAFLIQAGREGEVEQAAATMYDAGVRNVAAWGFRACAHMTALRPDRPEQVWDAVRASFRSLRQAE